LDKVAGDPGYAEEKILRGSEGARALQSQDCSENEKGWTTLKGRMSADKGGE